jgi:tRNA(adenine34) deaminase
MQEAIKEARKASSGGDVPVGCVIVIDDKIIARAHNLRHKHKNSLYHAEMLAIQKACVKLGRWILDDATIYITLEPCLMCTGAILQSRFKRLVYGKNEPKFGCVESVMEVFSSPKFNHRLEITKGICGDEIEEMMKSFFQNLRNNPKTKNIDN